MLLNRFFGRYELEGVALQSAELRNASGHALILRRRQTEFQSSRCHETLADRRWSTRC